MGRGLTKAKMADCRWLKPELVGQFEFLEWTGDNHLRHTRFVGLREDKRARRPARIDRGGEALKTTTSPPLSAPTMLWP
jgi:ATP-dependent DNA ligase